MSSSVLRVNAIRCDGHGICAELFPERIELDEWGFPVIDPTPFGGDLEEHARRAVAECPAVALLLGRARTSAPREA